MADHEHSNRAERSRRTDHPTPHADPTTTGADRHTRQAADRIAKLDQVVSPKEFAARSRDRLHQARVVVVDRKSKGRASVD
jgi:hypothetical protein